LIFLMLSWIHPPTCNVPEALQTLNGLAVESRKTLRLLVRKVVSELAVPFELVTNPGGCAVPVLVLVP